jgi:hypothetical protein
MTTFSSDVFASFSILPKRYSYSLKYVPDFILQNMESTSTAHVKIPMLIDSLVFMIYNWTTYLPVPKAFWVSPRHVWLQAVCPGPRSVEKRCGLLFSYSLYQYFELNYHFRKRNSILRRQLLP